MTSRCIDLSARKLSIAITRSFLSYDRGVMFHMTINKTHLHLKTAEMSTYDFDK